MELEMKTVLVIGAGYLFLLMTSGLVVNRIISGVMKESLSRKVSKKTRDTGFVVGKCENILILTFMLLGAYTALALIFAAKAIVRREDMATNSLYFLAGTMINVTYSVVVGVVVKIMLQVL